jgi:hypothetical protein
MAERIPGEDLGERQSEEHSEQGREVVEAV